MLLKSYTTHINSCVTIIWGMLQQNQTKWTFYKWEAGYDVAVKLTRVNDDILKSNNGAHGLVNFNAHFIIPECDKYKP